MKNTTVIKKLAKMQSVQEHQFLQDKLAKT